MNYYDLLEVSHTASVETIRAAYKALAKKYHPDVYPGNREEAERYMKHLNDAVELLCDSEKRAEYDAFLQEDKHSEPADIPEEEPVSGESEESAVSVNEKSDPPKKEFSFWQSCLVLLALLAVVVGLAYLIFIKSGLVSWIWGGVKSLGQSAGTLITETIEGMDVNDGYIPTQIKVDYPKRFLGVEDTVNIYLDDHKLFDLQRGKIESYEAFLSPGEHKLSIKSGLSTKVESMFKVGQGERMGYNEYVAYYYLDRFFGKYSLEQDEVNWQWYFTYDEKVSSLVLDVTEKNPLISKWENIADGGILEIEGDQYDGESFSLNGQFCSIMEQYGNYVRMSCEDGEKLFCISNDGNTLWQLRLVEEGDVGELEAEYTRSSPYKSKQTPFVQHKSLFRTWISSDTGEALSIDFDSFNGMGYSTGRDIIYENQDEYVLCVMNEAGGYTLYHILCSDTEMYINEMSSFTDTPTEYFYYTAS